MNLIHQLSSQLWVERFGWSLVHFLWQGLFIALLYAAVRQGMARRASPNTRYLLACATLAVMMSAPLVTWHVLGPSASPAADYRIQSAPPPASAAGTAATMPDSVRATVSTVLAPRVLPWVVMAWLAGAIVCWIRLAGGWMVAVRMRSRLVRGAPPDWQENLKALGARIGLTRPVRLLVSALVEVPAVVGWLRPVVLVPVGALGGLPAAHLEALLLHELAHIRRHDYLVNLLQTVAEALLFYHPAVWWVSGHMRAERELCCDDVAVSVSGDALTYASALAQLESHRPAHLHAAMAANGASLADRIARVLGQSQPAARTGLGPGVLALAVLLIAAAYASFGQSAARPAFQSAFIKPNPNPARHPMGVGYRPGGRMTATNTSLKLLIQFAYADHDAPHWLPLLASQVVGGPAWVDSTGYDIEAGGDVNTDSKQAWLMLQKLLADRFQLALHRETRETATYHLTIAGGGPKLPPAKEAGCVSFPPGAPPRPVPGKVDCGYVSGPFGGTPGLLHIQGRKVHISDLVRELASVLDRPILDKTAFTGEFDLDLSFGEATGHDIFAALQEQLGLKLVPARGPLEVLVIDRAGRPTAN